DRNRSHWSTSKTPSYTKSVSWQHHPNSHWCYLRAAQPHQNDFDYEFNTTFIDGLEFAIYERVGNYFVLVDFFKSYEEACDDAKKIIDDHPDIKKMFSAI
ncbi:hypothetical protein PO467_21200, partial [Enterobacter kobei]|uniref:hypothetical protein n=1 Tax=Enterobacter kobei TaxID=208224 RepID=UPI002FFAB65E